MGCDIHIHAEIKTNGKWSIVSPPPAALEVFGWRSYSTFAFLAGVRNYSAITPIAEPRGLPLDVSRGVQEESTEWEGGCHTRSWLSIEELASFDYGAAMEDCRHTIQTGPNSWDGGATCDKEKGIQTTYTAFLVSGFVEAVEALRSAGIGRLVFWFDN